MYVLDVSYVVENTEYSKSYLLCEASDGFDLKKKIDEILSQKHDSEIKIISTEIEEI